MTGEDTAARTTGPVPIDPLFRSITESSPDCIMLLDADARIDFISRPAPGLTAEQVVGTQVYEYVPTSQHAGMRECFAQVRATLQPGSYDNIYTTPDGAHLLWESRVAPVLGDGEAVGFVVIATDTTERRAAAIDRDRFFDLSLDMLCVASLDGYLKLINPSFRRVLGWTEAEMLASSLFAFVHPEDELATRDVFRGLAEGDAVARFENRLRCNDGTHRILQWQATFDPDTQRVHAVARDVTGERALQSQLLQSQKMNAIGQLAGGIAHDFNNLLLAVLANASFVAALVKDDPELSEPLEQIESAGRRAADLTKQLLAVSRRRPLHKEPLDLNRLVGQMMKMLRRLIPESIEIVLSDEAGLPVVEGDVGRLEQVILNLCLNARDAMPGGGRVVLATRKVVITDPVPPEQASAPAGDWVLLEVTDSGRGMSAEVRSRVFEPFFTTKRVGEGSGLGLATVYGIVEQHGGRVSVESEPGRGTCVKVLLPASDRQVASEAEVEPIGAARGAETILVAEDEELVRDVVVKILRSRGYTVLTAVDGREAVREFAARKAQIRLVLLDVVMPGISGPAAYRAMAEQVPGLPVLFTSGYMDPRRVEGALPEGTVLLLKPYAERELLARVRECIDAAQDATTAGPS